MFFWLLAVPAFAWESNLVHYDSNGMLVYEAEPSTGHRIGDFSYAGYMGGGVNIPDVNTVKTIQTTGGDDTELIQNAIDWVCALTPDANGIRGALLLEAGTYNVYDALYVTASGVVIRGEGDGGGGGDTIIFRVQDYDYGDGGDDWDCDAYQEGVLVFDNGGDTKNNHYEAGTTCNIIDDYVPVGSRVVHVEHPEYYSVGDRIVIDHPDTWDWLEAVDYGGCSWEPGDVHINASRRVVAINGNAIGFDAPLFFDIDKSLTQCTMSILNPKTRISNCGVEDLRVDIETSGSGTDDHSCHAIKFVGVDDCWALRATGRHFQIAGFKLNGAFRMTLDGCSAIDCHRGGTGGRGYNFFILSGQQILITNCYANHARHAYICDGSGRDNCNAFVNNTGEDNQYASEGHYRWVNGLLFDNHYEDSDDWNHIGFQRMGCEHGWATVHSVAWNCTLLNDGTIIVQQPPTAQNYAIGCNAVVTDGGDGSWQNGPPGYMEGTGDPCLSPSSLYEVQLAERLANPNDTTAPDTPAYLSATPDDNQVSLDWQDNAEFDLAGYNVYRDDSSGGPYSKINGSLLLSSSYIDTSVINDNTYYYVVTAEDVFSNESDNSNEVSATPRVPEPNETTFYAIEDTYANKYDENTNYGSDDDFQTHEVGKWSFLKFTVSDICGRVNEATLRVYCHNSENDTVNVKEVSDNSWDEDTLTWNNKPDMGSKIDDETISGTGWVEFDVTSYITANGTYSFGMDQDNTDKQKFYSKEYDSASHAPQLVVSYGELLPININFQLDSADVPPGYLKDDGAAYANRGNGCSYGWSSNLTNEGRERNTHEDQRYDTLVHLKADWEIELPNGKYDIDLVCGDPDYDDQINDVLLEGLLLDDTDGGQGTGDHFDEYNSVVVTVSDGKLTISAGPQSDNPKLCFIHINSYVPVNMLDFALFVSHWLNECTESSDWCDGMDYNHEDGVNFKDLQKFASRWLDY